MKLFNHRVRQDVAGNPRHLCLDLAPAEAAIERELEILALANLLYSFASYFLKSTLDCFSLRIQNALFE